MASIGFDGRHGPDCAPISEHTRNPIPLPLQAFVRSLGAVPVVGIQPYLVERQPQGSPWYDCFRNEGVRCPTSLRWKIEAERFIGITMRSFRMEPGGDDRHPWASGVATRKGIYNLDRIFWGGDSRLKRTTPTRLVPPSFEGKTRKMLPHPYDLQA